MSLAYCLDRLRVAYPRADLPDETLALYAEELGQYDDEDVAEAIVQWTRSNVWPPTLAELLSATRAIRRRKLSERALPVAPISEAERRQNVARAQELLAHLNANTEEP